MGGVKGHKGSWEWAEQSWGVGEVEVRAQTILQEAGGSIVSGLQWLAKPSGVYFSLVDIYFSGVGAHYCCLLSI